MAWAGVALVVAISVAAALLLRSARCPGWAVVGGVCAGVLLGPTLLGRFAPSMFEQMYIGGRAQQRELEARQAYEHLAAAGTGLDDAAIESLQQLHAARDATQWEHQQPIRVATLFVVGLVLLGTATGPRGLHGAKPQLVQSLTIGGWSALLPGGIAFVVLHLLLNVEQTTALLASSAVAIGPWQFTGNDIAAADKAEIGGARLLHHSRIVASTIAVGIAMYAAWRISGMTGLLVALPLIALLVGQSIRKLDAQWIDGLVQFVLLPVLAALAAIKVELFIHFAIWPVLLFVALSGDGRWLGAFIGAMLLGGRRALRTMRLAIGVMACGPTQIAVAAIAGHGGLLDGSLLLAILSGAVLIEVFTPARRALAERIAQTEAELDELIDE